MTDRHNPDPDGLSSGDQPVNDSEPILTSPEDVASAGRSCMAIVVLGAIIVLVLVIWVVYRAVGGL